MLNTIKYSVIHVNTCMEGESCEDEDLSRVKTACMSECLPSRDPPLMRLEKNDEEKWQNMLF